MPPEAKRQRIGVQRLRDAALSRRVPLERRVSGALERNMEKRNMASFAVVPRLIEQALTMPDGHEIVGAEWDFSSRTVRLYVEGPDLPEVECGQIVPSITPTVTVATGDDGKRVHTWHWNAANAQ